LKTQNINLAIQELKRVSCKDKAKKISRFFKDREKDRFLGVYVPDIRKIAKRYINLSSDEVHTLLQNEFHEVRFLGVVTLVYQFQKFEEKREDIYKFYLENLHLLNSWDLVDVSAPHILGEYLLKTRNFSTLEELSQSKKLFVRRASIVSTLTPIKDGIFQPTLDIGGKLLDDRENLIHKAIGWTLREVSKRDRNLITKFIEKNYSRFPRVALRSAIEKYPKYEQKRILRGEFKPTF